MANGMQQMWSNVAKYYRSVTGATSSVTPEQIMCGMMDMAGGGVPSIVNSPQEYIRAAHSRSAWVKPSSYINGNSDWAVIQVYTATSYSMVLLGSVKWSSYGSSSDDKYWCRMSTTGAKINLSGPVLIGYRINLNSGLCNASEFLKRGEICGAVGMPSVVYLSSNGEPQAVTGKASCIVSFEAGLDDGDLFFNVTHLFLSLANSAVLSSARWGIALGYMSLSYKVYV